MANRKRLIERFADRLKEAYQEAQKDNRALKSFMDFCLEKATEEASDHTVTDIVPVVRCKDCKHFVSPQGVPCCDNFMGLGFPTADGSDFCSYGERREGE